MKPNEYFSILDMLEDDLFMAVRSIPSLSITHHATENHPEEGNPFQKRRRHSGADSFADASDETPEPN